MKDFNILNEWIVGNPMLIRSLLMLLYFTTNTTGQAQNLSGQVYILTESFARDKCNAEVECDCCSAELIFLTSDEFAYIHRCVQNDLYRKGQYKIKGDRMVLTFSLWMVAEIFDDENTAAPRNVKRKLSIDPIEFSISDCDSKLILQQLRVKVLTKGFRLAKELEDEIKTKLLNRKAWQILQPLK